jgi:3-oxoacyl-[acyl-carrier protein] reductase
MDLRLAGRRAVVPAASAGLGFAVACALGTEGAVVAICGRDRARVERAAGRVGSSAIPIVADVTSRDGALELVDEAETTLGGIDILILNGPGPPPGTFASTPSSAYAASVDAGMIPPIEMCRATVCQMQSRGWGRIVAVTSIAVRQPIASLILSNTIRTGLTGFLKTLAREVAADGVTVNSVQPGLHDTARLRAVHGDQLEAEIEQTPAHRLGDAANLGSVVAFLCSDQASFITGAAVPVDGGLYAGLL